MASIKDKRIEQGLTQQELAKRLDKDVPLISKFENFVCLPVPEDAHRLASVLNCNILEIYDEAEITFIQKTKSTKKPKDCDLNSYKLTAELPRDAVNWLTKENLSLLGFASIRAWANDCYERFVKRIKKKKSHLGCNQNDSNKE